MRAYPTLAAQACQAKERAMKRNQFLSVAVSIIILGVSLLAWPSVGHAYTISSVSVSYNAGAFVFGPAIWTYPITLGAGETALLSQTNTTPFNFDTSDPCIGIATCGAPTITITTGLGVSTYSDTAMILDYPVGIGGDRNILPPLETHEYVAATLLSGPNLGTLQIGYVDDAHLRPGQSVCTDSGANCRPDPFTAGGGPNQFQATASGTVLECGFTGPNPCFDAGVLRLTAAAQVPFPATLVLLGAGFTGLAASGWRRAHRNR
jgi:hypothetical protein